MEEKIYRYSSMLTLPKFIFVVSSIVMFYIPDGDGLMILARAFLISQIISLFASVYFSRIALRKSVKAGLDLTNLKKMLSFGFPLIFSSLGFWLLTGMDKFFIKELSTYEELGKYAIAANFTAVITIFSTVLLNVYNPKVYQWNANNECIEKYTSVMYLVSFLCFCIWSLSGVFSWLIPITLPNEINDTEIIFSVLIGGPIMKLLSESTKVGIGISRRSHLAVIPILIAVIFNAILNYLFIPLYGAIGAACSSLVSFYILLIARTEISSRCWSYFSRSNYYYLALLFMIISLMSIYFIKIEFGTAWYSFFWLVIFFIVVGACLNKCRKCLKVVLG
jgi:O-antigen/teichoic acid export membrane protein